MPQSLVTSKFKLCFQKSPGFYALCQHKNIQDGFFIKTANFDPDDIINEVDDTNLKEDLRSCQHFLVDSELERARHKVFNYAVGILNAKIVDKNLNHFFINLTCAAKVNLVFRFLLKNIEDRGFRHFYAHGNNILLDCSKLVCIRDNLAKLKDILNKTDVTKSCSRKRMHIKWRLYKLTNLTVFAALLKDVPMGCKDAVLHEPLLKKRTINCLTFEESTRQPNKENPCLSQALVLHLHENQ